MTDVPVPFDSVIPPWVDDLPVIDAEGEGEGWSIRDDGSAEWAMARCAAAQAELGRIQDQYDLWRTRLDEAMRAASEVPRHTLAFFAPRLEAYGAAVREMSDDRIKTVHLPSGAIATQRGSAPKVIIINEDVLIEWAFSAGRALDEEPGWITYAEMGVVATQHRPRVSALRELVHIVHVDAGDNDGVEEWRVVTPEGELVPGVDVELPVTKATVNPNPLGLDAVTRFKEI